MNNLVYCSREQVKALLKLQCPLIKVIVQNGERPIYYTQHWEDGNWQECEAYYYPYLEEVVKWLRDAKNIHIDPDYNKVTNSYQCFYDSLTDSGLCGEDCNFEYPTFEKALKAGIDKAIEILNLKN